MKRYVYSLSPHGVRVSDILINIGSDIVNANYIVGNTGCNLNQN